MAAPGGGAEYVVTSRRLFAALRRAYLAGALTAATLLPTVAAGVDHALFALREGVGHSDLRLTCDVLDARGVVSVTERGSYIWRVRALAARCAEAWLARTAPEAADA
jgi:hypothetical protein